MTKQKTFLYFFIAIFVFFSLVIFGLKVPKALAIAPGDLIKTPNSPAVYYVGEGNTKYVFPNSTTYLTWYPDFSLVQTVTAETLQNYNIAGNVVARAGTKLIQFVAINPDGTMTIDDPKVYALEPNGVRRWITTADLAQQLYGPNWESKIYASPNYLIISYPLGDDITNTVYPEGSLVKQGGSANVYYINGENQRQLVTATGFTENLFQDQYVITTSLCLTCYTTGTTISSNVSEITILAGGASANIPDNSFYVATNGNDNNLGTITSPFRTISKASTVAQPGDIIYIRGGTYDETITPPNSGTENNYITFTNYPGETVLIRGTTGFVFLLENVDYIRIKGLKIIRGLGGGLGSEMITIPAYQPYIGDVAHGAGIKIFYGDYNIITNNEIYDNDLGIYVSPGLNDMPSNHNEIINNVIHHNGEAGIRIKRSDYTTADSNTIYNNGLKTNNVYSGSGNAPGIAYYCTNNTTITNNTIYGNLTLAIHNYAGTDQETCDASSSLIKNNIFSQALTYPWSNQVSSGKKIVFSVAQQEATDPSHIYKQNTFYNGTLGSDIISWGENNFSTIGETITLAEFNALANNLNSDSGVGNIEVSTNPIQ